MNAYADYKAAFYCFGYSGQQTYGFCAKCHIGGFSLGRTNNVNFDRAPTQDRIKTDDPKELALFLARNILRDTGYTKTTISDIVGGRMHSWISDHLPDEFTDYHRDKVKVLREEPYRNRNSSNMVQEVVLHRVY